MMEDWYIIIQHNNGSLVKLENPTKKSYYADPFLYCFDSSYYVFFEEFNNIICKGHISVCKIELVNNQVVCGRVEKIIDETYHLSYPFLITCESKTYMIPESYQAKTIYLYECINFPNQWQKTPLINNIDAVDTTILFYENVYWLFTSVFDSTNINRYLCIYYSDKLQSSRWIAHPVNKMKLYGNLLHGSGRGAGNIYSGKDGFYYRPIQMSKKYYGESIQINKILVLTTDDFIEVKHDIIQTHFDSGTHHIVTLDNYNVVDVKRFV